MSCNLDSLLNDALGKIDIFRKGIEFKINTILSELQDSLDLDSFLSENFNKIKEAFAGKLISPKLANVLNKLEFLFPNGEFQRKNFLILASQEYSEYRRRENEKRLSSDSTSGYNYVRDDAAMIEYYETLINFITKDVNDLIFITKLNLEENIQEVNDRNENIENIASVLADIEYEINKIDEIKQTNPSEIISNAESKKNKIANIKENSKKMLDFIIEMNQVDVSFDSDNFDKASYLTASEILEDVVNSFSEEETPYNPTRLSNAIKVLPDLLLSLARQNQSIQQRTNGFVNFISSYKENYSPKITDRIKIIEIVSISREIKNLMDDFVESPELYSSSHVETVILSKLLALYANVSIMDDTGIEEIERVESLNNDDEERENLNKYEEASEKMISIIEGEENMEYDDEESYYQDSIIKLNSYFNRISKNETSSIDNMRQIVDELKNRISLIGQQTTSYQNVYSEYNVKENIFLERITDSLKGTSLSDLWKSIKAGDWKDVFSVIGGSVFNAALSFIPKYESTLRCILSQGISLDSVSESINKAIGSVFGKNNNSSLSNMLASRKDFLRRGYNTLKKQKIKIQKIEEDMKKQIDIRSKIS